MAIHHYRIYISECNRPMESISHAVYFWFSMVFLIGRTMAVSLLAAQVHDESKKPAEILCLVPTDSWCLELSRFSDEVNTGLIALSGMRFFYLTRRLILSVKKEENKTENQFTV